MKDVTTIGWSPLAGVKVLDFTPLLPGPMATCILGDLGAEVIKVEPPQGDAGRKLFPRTSAALNRNKRSIALDLKAPQNKEVIARLARWADVSVEAFRPGVADRLGIGGAALQAINRGLVQCSLSGYGQQGPWRLRPGHDINYLAAAGGLAFKGRWNGRPERSSLPIGDLLGASFAVISILAALRERDATGIGPTLDISILDSVYFCTEMRHGLSDDPSQASENRLHLQAANDCFATLDGRMLAVALVEDHFWNVFRTAVSGQEAMLLDSRFDTDKTRREHGSELSSCLTRLFKRMTATEWLALLEPLGLPIDICASPEEAARNPQLGARGVLSASGQDRHVPFPARRLGDPPRANAGAAPAIGQHTEEILCELGIMPN